MDRGNVLVIGNSGVGKSTLINAALGEDLAVTGWGTAGTTSELKFYECDGIPFRLIDSVGFEPSKERKAINAIKKWSKDSAKQGHEDSKINVIWFCVDGTARKLFPKSIESLLKATAMWKSVPIIVVITKSYSSIDQSKNIEMVNRAFSTQKRNVKKPCAVLPVVAEIYSLNATAFAAPEGVAELIDATNKVMPEGIKAAERDVFAFKLKRKRVLAQSIVGVSTGAGVAAGAIPVPFADAAVLVPVELGMVNGLARLYGIGDDEESKKFLNMIVEVGTVGLAAKNVIEVLKAVPGVNIGANVLNAAIAGGIVTALGEGSIYVFEKIYLGEKSVADIEWVKKVMEARLASQFIDKLTDIIKSISEKGSVQKMLKAIPVLLAAAFSSKDNSSKDKREIAD